ncbi:MAG: hypothetical protein RIS85_2369 [Pseudomonadota bacterium]
MQQDQAIGFPLAVVGGIILGAVIGNMAIGLLIGFAVGFGWIKLKSNKS